MDTTKRMPAKKMKKTTTEEENSVQGARRDWKSVCQYGMRFVTHIFLLPFLASREKGSVGWGGALGCGTTKWENTNCESRMAKPLFVSFLVSSTREGKGSCSFQDPFLS